MALRPLSRQDFEIAIICALPLEYDAVALLFDEFWDKDGDIFGRAVADPNTYTTGRIGKHNVVLALLSRVGKANAAAAAASLRSSYVALRLVLLAGICGGVPYHGEHEILLGDVIISSRVIQHDLGRMYPDGFVRKNTAEDNLNKHDKNIRNFLAIFNTDFGRDELQKKTARFLNQLQAKAGNRRTIYKYPGIAADKLFESSYRHKHRISATCICSACHGRMDPVCAEALSSLCDDLHCDERYLVQRNRAEEQVRRDVGQDPAVFVGAVASGDTLIKSGEDRDTIAQKEGIIAFEMEGAGVWEEVPCVVVKGVCDYADCHKNKRWQNFAAATAASTVKAILERYIQTYKGLSYASVNHPKGHFLVPFGRNQNFVGRKTILSKLLKQIPPTVSMDNCQRIVIEGLGGVGKTQIALEAVYRIRDEHPDCSVFWVPAVDATSFENACRDAAKRMNIEPIEDDNVDIKQLFMAALSNEKSGTWLLVIDNLDDLELPFGASSLGDVLPFSRKGSILFTTRSHKVAIRLDVQERDIITVAEMDTGEALDLLQKGLKIRQTVDTESTTRLLNILANLPIAIRQASAYMAENQIMPSEYLELCELQHENMIDLLDRDFEDQHRYKMIQNSVAKTWLVSFSYISQHNQLAAEYLKFMSFLANKDVPKSLLPTAKKIEAIEAIGILQAYAFIVRRAGQDSFDMHRLVQLAMQNWLKEKGELERCVASVMHRLNQEFPYPEHDNRDVWMKYLPHAQAVLKFPGHYSNREIESSLLFRVAVSLSQLGQYQLAEPMYREVVQLCEKLLGNRHPDTLSGMNNLALVLRRLGKFDEAERIHRQILELRKQSVGKDHPDTLSSMNNLGLVLTSLGKFKEAEHMYKALGDVPSNTLSGLNNLAITLQSVGKYEEAEELHRKTLELREQSLGKSHPDTLSSINNLGLVMKNLGRYEEAEQMHRQILELRAQALGDDHPDTLSSLNNLALVLRRLGQYEEAEHIHRKTLELRKQVLGTGHPDTISSMNNLALVLNNVGKYEEAEQIHRTALEVRQEMLGRGHPDTLSSMNNLGAVLSNLGRHEEAEPIYRQTLELRGKALGKEHPDTLSTMNNLGLVFNSLGQFKDAEQMHRKTLQLREGTLGKYHQDTLSSINNLAVALHDLGRHDEAGKLDQRAVELCEELFGTDHPYTKKRRNTLERGSRAGQG